MNIKLDLHVHSKFRGHTYITAEKLREVLIKRKLDGVAITNFFDISHANSLKEKLGDFIIIVGQEVWAKDGHIIGLGLNKKIPDFESAEQTIDEIHKQGGIAIAPHPYLSLGIGKKALSLPIDAMETYNALIAAPIIYNFLAKINAKKKNIPQTASTDTTNYKFLGRSYTEIMTDDKKSIFDAMRSGNTKLHKRPLPVPFIFILKNLLYFKNIKPCLAHAVPCVICGASMAVRLLKHRHKCLDCGKIEKSRVICSNGHYLCLNCIIKREQNGN